ncbi:MAG TPA: ABC transporter permease [Gemmatimonadales bacterium]|jgi:putative ABC transport system permease protein
MWFYRLLLHLYPASFRNEYGGEFATLFAERRARTHGAGRLAWCWIETVVDVASNAIVVHWDLLRQDVRQGFRSLSHAPSFAVTAILVIALGVGANAAAFSVADYVFLRPLPFPQADRLVTIWERVPHYSMMQPSPPNYRDWARASQSFDEIGAYNLQSWSILGGAVPDQVGVASVNGPLLDMLGAAPTLGRLPTADEVASGAPVVLLSYGIWQDDFGGDPHVVGRAVSINGKPVSVTGVMPKSFVFPDRSVRLWAPMNVAEAADTDRSNSWFYVVARLKAGRTAVQAQRDMDRVTADLARLYPQPDASVTANVMSLRDAYAVSSPSRNRALLEALCGAALCVLLITCANLASLLLVRALARRREIAVRAALGAGRERLIRQLLTESLMLAIAGGTLGVGIAFVALPLLNQLVPDSLPMAQLPTVDLHVLAAAALLSVATGIGFGVVPAVRTGRGSSFDGLRDDVRSGGGRRSRLRAALVIVEVAASVVLLVSAGLLLRAMLRVRAIDPGFRQDNVLTLRTELPLYRYWQVDRRDEFYREVLGRIRALPGVAAAGYTSFLPMKMGGGIWRASAPPDTITHQASLRYVTPGYFDAMRIRLERGRGVTDGDTHAAPATAVVSESFAHALWPGRDPIGQRFNIAFVDRTVVGVANNVRVRGPERDAEPQVYLPYQQVQDSFLMFYAPKDVAIRSTLPPAALVPAVRRIIRQVDPEQSVTDVQPLSAIVASQSESRAVQVQVLVAFAAIAFLLAGIGLHGLLAFAVSQRRQEMAVRMALGAEPGQIIRMILAQGGWLAIGGIIPGAFAGYAAGRVMSSILAGVEPLDAPTFITAMVLCTVMVVAGSAIPALHAVRVSPASVMRSE